MGKAKHTCLKDRETGRFRYLSHHRQAAKGHRIYAVSFSSHCWPVNPASDPHLTTARVLSLPG